MREFRTTTQNFSPAAIEIDAAMRAGRLRHDGNPVLEWCLGNVVGRYDVRANVYPRNERPEQKTDAITTVVGIARCLAARPPGSRYNDPATRSSPLLDLASAGQRVRREGARRARRAHPSSPAPPVLYTDGWRSYGAAQRAIVHRPTR